MNVKGPPTLPRWVMMAGSVAIAFHLLAVVVLALSASSGPWAFRGGASPSLAPQFASAIAGFTTENYLRHLGLVHNYHFDSNRCTTPAVRFEVQVFDERGDVKQVLTFPDPHANFFVRQRQDMLAHQLGEDEPYQPAMGQVIPADVRAKNTMTFFYPVQGSTTKFELYEADVNQIPKEQVLRPSPRALLLARSYGEYARRQHGGDRVEVTRLHRDSLMPALMFPNPMVPGKLLLDQPGVFATQGFNFGDRQPKRWRPRPTPGL